MNTPLDMLKGEDRERFMRIFAGERVYIPSDIYPDHPLVKAIGLKLAQELCKFFGGIQYEIPNTVHHLDRRRKAQKLARDGFSNQAIAKILHVSRRTVRRWVL